MAHLFHGRLIPMGVSFCVVFGAEVPPHGMMGGDHTALARDKDTLDRLASENGLVPLSAFESYHPGDAAEFLDEEELAELPEAQWFDPASGLTAVRALAHYVGTRAGALANQDKLLPDLTGIEKELADAARAKVRFRFAIVA